MSDQVPFVRGVTETQGDLYFCSALRAHTIEELVEIICRYITNELGLTVRKKFIEQWLEGEACVLIVLEESHVIFTTYPKDQEGWFVRLVVELCNFKRDNYDKTTELYEGLKRIFAPTHTENKLVRRLGPDPEVIARLRREGKTALGIPQFLRRRGAEGPVD